MPITPRLIGTTTAINVILTTPSTITRTVGKVSRIRLLRYRG